MYAYKILESKDPAFLRKLKSEYQGHDEAQHRRPQARPKKQNSRDDEDDDEPIYIDEQTQNPVPINEYKALLISHEAKPNTNRSLPSSSSSPPSSGSRDPQAEIPTIDGIKSSDSIILSQQREVSIGVNSKKRLARVVGSGHEEVKNTNTRKTKAKKVKLCFDEDDES